MIRWNRTLQDKILVTVFISLAVRQNNVVAYLNYRLKHILEAIFFKKGKYHVAIAREVE